MPNQISGLSPLPPIEASVETLTEASSPKYPSEKVLENDELLGFWEQVAVVRDGFRKGVHYDGCTAVPDFDFGADCCGEHDYHYQLGDITRSEADTRLRQCIRKKGYIVLPWVFWLGVRIFGGGYYRKKQNEIFPLADDVADADSVRDLGREA
jgi:hypothetical protein